MINLSRITSKAQEQLIDSKTVGKNYYFPARKSDPIDNVHPITVLAHGRQAKGQDRGSDVSFE